MISFNVSKQDGELIARIAARAQAEIFDKHGLQQTELDTQMDLSATIAQGCALRLDELLVADPFNFSHDVCGIRRHLDRNTGKLGGFFLPRFARPQTQAEGNQ